MLSPVAAPEVSLALGAAPTRARSACAWRRLHMHRQPPAAGSVLVLALPAGP